MGLCYSKKAREGLLQPHTISHMATSKPDDASRLARPTPYCRNANMSVDYGTKRGIPKLSTPDGKSNIPRFGSNHSSNDNEVLHAINNNSMSSTPTNPQRNMNIPRNAVAPRNVAATNSKNLSVTATNSPRNANSLNTNSSKTPVKSEAKPKNVGTKSTPNERPARPGRGSGIFRHFVGNKSPSRTPAAPTIPKMQAARNIKVPTKQIPPVKSPSNNGFRSHDSLSDFDSGLGTSLNNERFKPEDTDTVKDIEHIELHDELSPNSESAKSISSSTPKAPSDPKLPIKAPIYRRESNGKWCFDERHFGAPTVHTLEPKPFPSPRERHTFKMNASDNIFSTYASYKGLLSYQRKNFKPAEMKVTPQVAIAQGSAISKRRKGGQSPPSPAGSVFYVKNDSSAESTPKAGSKYKLFDSDDRSDSTEGVTSPPSVRDFLIDDEISDQPLLTIGNDPQNDDSDVQSLKLAMSELHALQMASSTHTLGGSISKRRTDSVGSYKNRDSLLLGSEMDSSCSSIGSDDLMLDYEKTDIFPDGTINEGPATPERRVVENDTDMKNTQSSSLNGEKKFDFDEKQRKRLSRRSSGPSTASERQQEWRQRTISLPLRPPRQMSIAELDDGGLKLDSSSYRLLCQDLNSVKTLLFRLKSVIQEAETINPFDQYAPNNIFYQSLVQNDLQADFTALVDNADGETKTPDIVSIFQENADLRRQLVLSQQQLEDKDHVIHLLQQQMTKYLNVEGNCNHSMEMSLEDAATQTEEIISPLGSSFSEDCIETLVSVQANFENSFRKSSKENDALSGHLLEVTRLLNQTSI